MGLSKRSLWRVGMAGAGIAVTGMVWRSLSMAVPSMPSPDNPVVESINTGIRSVVGDAPVDAAESKMTGFFCWLFGGCEVDDYGFVFCDEFGMCYEVSEEQGHQLLTQNPQGRLKTVLKRDIKGLTENNSQS